MWSKLVDILHIIATYLRVVAKQKEQDDLDDERKAVLIDPVRYANDRWLRKPADSGDMPGDATELDDRRNEP